MANRTDVTPTLQFSARSLFAKTFRLAASHPRLFLIASLPTLMAETGFDFLPPPDADAPLAYAALLLPMMAVFCFLLELSNGAFYLWIRDTENTPASTQDAKSYLLASAALVRRWLPPILCAVLLIFSASFLILPAIYFMAVFAFITPCAMENPKAKTLDILVLSRRLVHLRFWKIFPIVCLLVVTETVLSFGLAELAARWLATFPQTGDIFWLSAGLKLSVKLVSVSFHSYVSIFVALLFIYLWREREQIRLRNTGTHSPI